MDSGLTATQGMVSAAPQPKVLVVDDRHENHRAIGQILAYSNAKIYNAHSGTDALSLTLRHQFAVVLLDVMMPVMDGFETASLMRINIATKTTPIIFITAADHNEDFEFKGYELGAVDYLFKPIKPHTLASKVDVFLKLEQQRYQLQQTLEDIQRLENRNKLLLDSIGEGIIGTDTSGKIIFTNPATEKILGTAENALFGHSILEVIYYMDSEQHSIKWDDTPFYNNCRQGKSFHEAIGVFWNNSKRLIPIEYTATPIMEKGIFIGVVIAFQDITERRKTEEQLARLAQYDSLTGLMNRYAFDKTLHQSMARIERNHGNLSLFYIDLDQFKQVNDNLGHEIGDFLLQEVALRLKDCVRGGDVISRLGGDEFTIILESYENQSVKNVAFVANKILASLAEPFVIRDNIIHIGASIGIAVCSDSAQSSESLMRSADLAMYKAKDSGRNNYKFFTDTMQEEARIALDLEYQLREAADNKDFQLYFQPKIDLKTGLMMGVEALLRWKNHDGAYISPDIFVPKLEEMGLINKVGEWIINEACQQTKTFIDTLDENQHFTVAINLSMRQLEGPNIANIIEKYLKKHQLKGHYIEVEITESMMMKNPEKTIEQLEHLHKLGVTIAIDDFGTGYSSLSYLHNLPIDSLKIDKSFVQKYDESQNTNKIIRSIVSLAQNLNLRVIAEGVETKDQLDFINEINCDVIQGYYFSKPIPADQLVSQLKKQWYNATG